MDATLVEKSGSLGLKARLRTRWFGLRFVEPETEQRYREWRIETATPFARIGYIGSAPSWALLLPSMYLISPESFPTAAPAIVTWIVLLLVLTLLTYWEGGKRTVMPLAALANCVAGFLIAWLLYQNPSASFDAPVRAGFMTAGVLIVLSFGFAIFRISPQLALTAVTPYILFAIYYLYSDLQTGLLRSVEVGGFVAGLLIAYMGGLLVCIVIEGLSRRTFSKDEIILEQRSQLTKGRDAIRRYMPPAVAEQIISGNEAAIVEPKRQRLTMLFSDIVGFTDIADRVEPEVMTQIIGEYMAAMTEIIDAHHGTVNEFIGDGLMALFGAPNALDPEAQARQAILSAQAMQAKLPELNHYWRRLGLGAALEIRTGINTGMVSVGSYGSQGRMTYTAIGLQTNIAARIQSHCEPGSVLISESTYNLVDDVIDCEPRGTIECKGVHFPVKVYTPLGRKS